MSMSLDGFIAGPNAGPGNGLGDGGERLHEWSFNGQMPVNGQVFDEFIATGAPSSRQAAGAATTTTACRSGSSAAANPVST
jgi:hypothetical protein